MQCATTVRDSNLTAALHRYLNTAQAGIARVDSDALHLSHDSLDVTVTADRDGVWILHITDRHGTARISTGLDQFTSAPVMDAFVAFLHNPDHVALAHTLLRAGEPAPLVIAAQVR